MPAAPPDRTVPVSSHSTFPFPRRPPTPVPTRHTRRSASLPPDDVAIAATGGSRRTRLRRGGPRTPLPLLPLIAALAGVGVAYVAQSAHATEATYRAASLTQDNQQLRGQDAQLGDELARLESGERIVAAAQQLGMRPATHWSYVDTGLRPVVGTTASTLTGGSSTSDPFQQFVATVGGAFGVHGAAAR